MPTRKKKKIAHRKRPRTVLYIRKVGAKNTFVRATASTPAHKTRYRKQGRQYIAVASRKKPARKRR